MADAHSIVPSRCGPVRSEGVCSATVCSCTVRTMLGYIPRRDGVPMPAHKGREVDLRSFRARGDPLGDRVAVALHATEGGLMGIHDLLGQVRRRASDVDSCSTCLSDADADAEAYAACSAFVRETRETPSWADFKKMERAQTLLSAFMPLNFISLGLGSLLGVGGQFPKMGDIVRATGMLDAKRKEGEERLERTSAFVLSLMKPTDDMDEQAEARISLKPGGSGFDEILRIRLLHGAVRVFVKQSGRYHEENEVPICQHDLGITLGLFSYIHLRNLRRLGVYLTQEDVESHLLLWRYVGHVLGVEPELLNNFFSDFDAQRRFFHASTLLMGDDCEKAGQEIVKSFHVSAAKLSRSTYGIIPSAFMFNFMMSIMIHLGGEEYMRKLPGIEDYSGRSWSVGAIKVIGGAASFIDRYVPFGTRMLSYLNVCLARASAKRNGYGKEHRQHRLRSKL